MVTTTSSTAKSRQYLVGMKSIILIITLAAFVLCWESLRLSFHAIPPSSEETVEVSTKEKHSNTTSAKEVSSGPNDADDSDKNNESENVDQSSSVNQQQQQPPNGQQRPISELFQYPYPTVIEANSTTRVIAMISMGPSAMKSILVERCVMSLRTKGQYDGLIWLLTDAPPNRYKTLASRDPNFIPMVPPNSKDWMWHLPDDMPYKRFKTLLLEYLDIIPEPYAQRFHNIEWVYYLDIDIVAGKPLSDWFHHIEETYKYPVVDATATQSQMMVFEGNYDHAPLQGGQFIIQKHPIHKNHNDCLRRWRENIDDTPTESKDQVALFRLWNDTKKVHHDDDNKDCKIIIMPKEPYLKFIQKDTIRPYIRTDLPPREFDPLMHIKNTQSSKLKIKGQTIKLFFHRLLDLDRQELNWITRSSYNVAANHTWSQEQLRTSK